MGGIRPGGVFLVSKEGDGGVCREGEGTVTEEYLWVRVMTFSQEVELKEVREMIVV